MLEKIIIVFGMWGVGKSRYCNEFIKTHPEYVIMPATAKIKELNKHTHIIMDYYFFNDWNATELRKKTGCPIEIRVLFDRPENIAKRQIFLKNNIDDVSVFTSINLYLDDLRHLIYAPDCVFTDGINNLSYHEFIPLYNTFTIPTEKLIAERMKEIKNSIGYDYNYQTIDLPHGFSLGRSGYSLNTETWGLIKNWVDWNNKTVLDIGCNNGYFSQEIWLKGGNPTGIDNHADALYSASLFAFCKNMEYKLIKVDINGYIPPAISKTKYDIALCLNVFQFITNTVFITDFLVNVPVVIFEVNSEDVQEIKRHFRIKTNIQSPKCDGTRRLLLCVQKSEEKT